MRVIGTVSHAVLDRRFPAECFDDDGMHLDPLLLISFFRWIGSKMGGLGYVP